MFADSIIAQLRNEDNNKFGYVYDENGLPKKIKKENGDLEIETVNINFEMPNKKKYYSDEEEYEKLTSNFDDLKEYANEYFIACKKQIRLVARPTNMVDKNTIKKIHKNACKDFNAQIANENKRTIENAKRKGIPLEQIQDELKTYKPGKFIDFSEEEMKKREKLSDDAYEVLSDNLALMHTNSKLITGFLTKKFGTENKIPRSIYAVLNAGSTSIKDTLNDLHTVLYGSKDEVKDLFTKKVKMALNTMKELSERKFGNDFINFYKENFQIVYSLTEFDGKKLQEVTDALEIDFPKDIKDELNKYPNTFFSGVGQAFNELGVMANPYYKMISENNLYELNYCHENETGEKTKFDYGKYFYMNKETELKDSLTSGKSTLDVIGSMTEDINFVEENKFYKDGINNYFNVNNISKVVDEKGNVITSDFADRITDDLAKGKTYLVYDENNNFKSKISLNYLESSFLNTNNSSLSYGNFNTDLKGSVAMLQKNINDLDSAFSRNHDEYKDLKLYILKMNEKLEKYPDKKFEIYEGLKERAVKYVESKFKADAPKKTQRTYDRIDFCLKVINTVNFVNRPALEAKNNNQNKIVDEEKFLKTIIEKNKENNYMRDVEKENQMVNNALEQNTKIQIDINEEKTENEPFNANENENKQVEKVNEEDYIEPLI